MTDAPPKRVRVLYFAAVRDLAGTSEETVDLPDSIRTVGELGAWLGARHAGLAARMASVRIARNEVFASTEEPVADGDVLALIPPVAGG